MIELSVNTRSPASITAAFKKIHEMTMTGAIARTDPVRLFLERGVYREILRYNLPNPLVLEGVGSAKATDCVIQAENCEAFHSGLENRAVCVFGPNATSVTVRNIAIVNTHVKTVMEGSTVPDSAEAFVWNNTNGRLKAEHVYFTGRQNTLHVRGFSWFVDCQIEGDVDFISGDCDTALFEGCRIHVREDNRGDYGAYAVKSLALAEKPGFLFSSCTFTADRGRQSPVYVYRTAGKGAAGSVRNWDSMALLNCQIEESFSPDLVWDDDLSLAVYPRGNAKMGLREYNTRVIEKNGQSSAADTSRRHVKSYILTDDDYFKGYASRFLLLQQTPFAETGTAVV